MAEEETLSMRDIKNVSGEGAGKGMRKMSSGSPTSIRSISFRGNFILFILPVGGKGRSTLE